jgi:hypothetical protein
VTRRVKPTVAIPIETELADLRPERYSSPLARMRIGRILRRWRLGGPLQDDARELGHAREEEAAYRRLVSR